jgi:predicted AAA+ superfamily ATPase
MTLFEMRQLEPNDYLSWFHRKNYESLNKSLIQRQIEINKNHKDDYLTHGGLPGICFLREKSFRYGQMKSHIETLLQRDIHQISKTTASYDSLLLLLQYLAIHQGQSFVLKDAASYSRLSQVTVKKIIAAFEGLFLIRRMSGFGFKNSPRFFLEDQGMAHYLAPVSDFQRILRWVLSQAFGNCHYAYMSQYQFGYFESKYSHEIPVVAKLGDQLLGFLFEDSESPSSHLLNVAKEFTNHNTNAKLLILGEYKQITPLDSQTLLCPWQWIS